MDSRELPASSAAVWSIPQALILLDRSERKVAGGPGKTGEREGSFWDLGAGFWGQTGRLTQAHFILVSQFPSDGVKRPGTPR